MSKAAAKRALTLGSQWYFSFDGSEQQEREVGKAQTNAVAFYKNFSKEGSLTWLYFDNKEDIFTVTGNEIVKTNTKNNHVLTYTKVS